MDPANLQTASVYVNNLLLSRGLLRNGTPLEFSSPADASGNTDATMAKIINLVHDLVLRRDRETETLSSLSASLHTLRTTATTATTSVTHLTTQNADIRRQLNFATMQERSAKAGLRTAENRNRALREEMARLKISVGQIRAQCAGDVRRRDGEIARLKKYLEVRRGGEGGRGQVGVTVVGLSGRDGRRETGAVVNNGGSFGGMDTNGPGYSLKEETAEFLTQLSQNLSEENDALIGLVKSTLLTLKSLQGLGDESEPQEQGEDPNVMVSMPPSYEKLAMDMDGVLEQLRGLLTNPSFVPLEEVELREEEIHRLREGWEKMEARWREAVSLMAGWRRRMMESGDTINLDDLRKGLDLGTEEITPPTPQSAKSNASRMSLQSRLSLSNSPPTDKEEVYSVLGANRKGIAISPSKTADLGVGLFPAPNILRSATGNSRPSPSPRKAPSKIVVEDLDDENDGLLEIEDAIALLEAASPARRTRFASEEFNVPTLTVEEKLQRAQREAEEAAKRSVVNKPSAPVAVLAKAVKRTAIPRVKKSRRRSTLSPDELESLMGLK